MQQSHTPLTATGTRARRRSVWLAGLAGGLLLVAGILHYVTGVGVSGTRHDTHDLLTGSNTPPPQHNPYGTINLGIAYGTTSKQVLRQLGMPTEKHLACWVYRGRVGTIRGRYSGPWVNAMKFCFSEGAPAGGRIVTQILSHRVSHQKAHTKSRVRIPAFWGWPINREPVPDWYVQDNS